jgi:hypothetical protein
MIRKIRKMFKIKTKTISTVFQKYNEKRYKRYTTSLPKEFVETLPINDDDKHTAQMVVLDGALLLVRDQKLLNKILGKVFDDFFLNDGEVVKRKG